MKSKSLILITMLIIFICGLFAAAFALIPLLQKESNNNQVPNEPNEPDENVIIIGGENVKDYKYVAINSDDTVSLYTELGKKVDILLEKKGWQNIKWSEDSLYLSVLGEQKSEKPDLNIYDFENRESFWITDYSNEQTGINSYQWITENMIFFNQGFAIDNWLHRFIYPNFGELIKLARIDGEIIDVSPNKRLIVYKLKNGLFKVYNLEGKEQWNISEIKTEESKSIKVKNVIWTEEQDKLVIYGEVDGTNKIFKINFNQTEAIEVKLTEGFIPICSQSADSIVGYIKDDVFDTFILQAADVRTERESLIFEINLRNRELLLESLKCVSSNKILMNIKETNSQQETEFNWYTNQASEVLVLPYLKNAKEVVSLPELE